MRHSIVPKNFRKDSSIKSLIIHGKEWFDKINGNSYNAVQVTVNYGMKNQFSFAIPFQYGYGDYYEQSAFEHLQKIGIVSNKVAIYDRQYKGKTVIDSYIDRDCLKRDVVSFGKALDTI